MRGTRQVNNHLGSAPFPAPCGDLSTMHFHELFCNTQAETKATLTESKIAGRMAAGVELGEKWLE